MYDEQVKRLREAVGNRDEKCESCPYTEDYNDNLTIDRINPSGNYDPSNCRWASVREQANNKQGALWIEYGGERMQLSYWADKLELPYHTLYDRLYRLGWPIEKALTTPVRRNA